jgi:hypothetical protein
MTETETQKALRAIMDIYFQKGRESVKSESKPESEPGKQRRTHHHEQKTV